MVGEFELLNFFGVEPARLDPDVPWHYNDLSYEVSRGGLTLSFGWAPAYKEVRIVLKGGAGETIYELAAGDVQDVKYHHEKDRELLEIGLGPHDVLWLRVQPSISIHQINEGRGQAGPAS